MAHALSVGFRVGVLALGGLFSPALGVVAVVAEALSVVWQVRVHALSCQTPLFPLLANCLAPHLASCLSLQLRLYECLLKNHLLCLLSRALGV